MNLSNLKYAVEVEKTGSITKAAQNFYMNQPHLSKIIRELERDLGCPIFDRTSRGMVPTRRGEEFLRHARAILVQEEQLEALCQKDAPRSLLVSLAAPRSFYCSYAFSRFLAGRRDVEGLKVQYLETNSRDVIQKVAEKAFDLGILRCQSIYAPYYQKLLHDENLSSRLLWEFSCSLLMTAEHPLAGRTSLTYLDLEGFPQISQGDMQPASFTFDTPEQPGASPAKTVAVYDRASQIDLLLSLPGAYLWDAPVPYRILADMNLIQRPCSYPGNLYQDFLIYRSGRGLLPEEQELIQCLYRTVSQLS